MDEEISKLFLPVIDKLYNNEPAGEPFREPVDPYKYGCVDYYLYVKHPIDLSTIRKKLVNKEYKDAWRFVTDVELMFSNAYLFNKKGTPVYDFTNKLCKIWNSELIPVMQRLNYCCGTLHKFGSQMLFCHGTTADKYCQIAIGARYRCYKDTYSFCIPCFNKIDTDEIDLQALTCETSRIQLPPTPVKKELFKECTNDHWQYECFIQCTKCTRRIHQICDLYPADDEEINECLQHSEIEEQQKKQTRVLPQFERFTRPSSEPLALMDLPWSENPSVNPQTDSDEKDVSAPSDATISEPLSQIQVHNQSENNDTTSTETSEVPGAKSESSKSGDALLPSLDNELLQLARDVENSHSNSWMPGSPGRFDENKIRLSDCNGIYQRDTNVTHDDRSVVNSKPSSYATCSSTASNSKTSVDRIAARLSSSKMSSEAQITDGQKSSQKQREKYVCNHCYRKERLGINLRHRRYSARRLPHTRMSRFIETKVNEYIRENSPNTGEVTIRVLAAYNDVVEVKPAMQEYIRRSRESTQHSNLEDYPDKFNFVNRAIFAWQEIDGVDVCVFGMHVQEYGEDCPEPNKQVVYLSYLDSVHFFRPKQFRTAVYHEILLSYFKYVKKLGFRRVYIWVCPSRKGDDYIFYRHPSEQKMPNLKRLSDWYVQLLDKGILDGIVERHQNIYDYALSENWNSLASMPYLSGDYWPGEFERLLNIMIESQKKYEEKLSLLQKIQLEDEETSSTCYYESSSHNSFGRQFNELDIKPGTSNGLSAINDTNLQQFNILPLTKIYSQPVAPSASVLRLTPPVSHPFNAHNLGFDSPSDLQEPLDLTNKNASNISSLSYVDDDSMSELSFASSVKKKRRKSSSTMGYTKKRSKTSQNSQRRPSQQPVSYDSSSKHGKSQKSMKSKNAPHSGKDQTGPESLLTPSEELMKNLERSLKRQKEAFLVVRLSDCDCSPHFESQLRREELQYQCSLMRGREPFLQLARQNNYEFCTLRRAKFSSLAMVKHLATIFKLDPICKECFSFDLSKRHYSCSVCEDFYLCSSCNENIGSLHQHFMDPVAPLPKPDIEDFLHSCSVPSGANSISSVSSVISNKSSHDISPLALPSLQDLTHQKKELLSSQPSKPLNRHQINSLDTPMPSSFPLSCQKQRNRNPTTRYEDEENAHVSAYVPDVKLNLPNRPSPPPSHASSSSRPFPMEIDQVMIENFVRHTELTYDVDFDEMKSESQKLLSHYYACSMKDTCPRCRFVVLSCSFMRSLMRSSRMQMVFNTANDMILPITSGSSNNSSANVNQPSGMNLTTSHRFI